MSELKNRLEISPQFSDLDHIEQWTARLELSSVWKEMLDNGS
jgi:hypothetical protein